MTTGRLVMKIFKGQNDLGRVSIPSNPNAINQNLLPINPV